MANDPHRDLLPVREDCGRSGKGFSDKVDHQILGKLSRCELEDRFLRLVDEQTHIKKLANSQEEKIKRLGTKLLRLINEKKSAKKFSEHTKETEDLHLRIIELEHENYTLKDKNTVLKQQLSSHSRHLLVHRSPLRSNHTSPLMTTRQSAPPAQSDCVCETNKNTAADMQLQEAETHIRELNEEIKCLHNKIGYLEQNLEKNNLDNRKIKVTENIELIRLQRSLKQQAIQIAALQEQVKNSEKSQKALKEELIKAHNENDDALNLISVKQSEILNLCSKLEEKNLNRLEEDELKERINDLMIERDCLKERSEFLMKSIAARAEESEKIKELEKLLAEEKEKKGKLEEAFEILKNNCKGSSTLEVSEFPPCDKVEIVLSQEEAANEKKEMVNCACNTQMSSESPCSQESSVNRETETDTDTSETHFGQIIIKKKRTSGGKYVAEKMKLELELQYLRDMLRSQTLRCEAQQAEISRLMYELKLNENKCNETLQRLDWHLRIFENLEMRAHQNELFIVKNAEVAQQKLRKEEKMELMGRLGSTEKPDKPEKEVERLDKIEKLDQTDRVQSVEKPYSAEPEDKAEKLERDESLKPESFPQKETNPLYSNKSLRNNNDYRWSSSHSRNRDIKTYSRRDSSSEERFPSKLTPSLLSDISIISSPKAISYPAPETKKRFVDQTYLESSDEESNELEISERELFLKKLNTPDEGPPRQSFQQRHSFNKMNPGQTFKPAFKESASSQYSLGKDDSGYPFQLYDKEIIKDPRRRSVEVSKNFSNTVTITILWLKIKPESSLWRNDNVDSLFIDFSFLDVNGAETETPQSLPKPNKPNMECLFNFTQTITLKDSQMKMLQRLLLNPESAVVVFKVVSDSDKYDDTNGECEDVGVAVLTTKQFFDRCNKGPFQIPVNDSKNTVEVVGTLSVIVGASNTVLNFIK